MPSNNASTDTNVLSIDADVDVSGCHGPAWLASMSIREVVICLRRGAAVSGYPIPFVFMTHCRNRVWFSKACLAIRIRRCLEASFWRSHLSSSLILGGTWELFSWPLWSVSAKKPASLVARNEAMSRFPAPCALLPRACHKPFNVDVQSPHPSLEGRGNTVVLGDVMVMTILLGWWQKIKSCWWRVGRTGVMIVKQ